MTPALRRVLETRAALILDAPFFGTLAARLELREDPSCETAWTDGQSIGFHPEYILSLSHAELTGLLVHVVMHVAAGHPWRRDGRDPARWNEASDYAINGELDACGYVLPDGALHDPQYTGNAAEWIYDRLPAPDPKPEGDDSGAQRQSAPAGEVRDAPADADAPSEEEWRQAVAQAATLATARGEMPAGLERWARERLRPVVDWRSVLHRFAQSAAPTDFTWSRPASRYVPAGLYLPTLRESTLRRVVVAIDVSGSVDDVLLNQFAAELRAVADDVRPETIEVIYCDARIQNRAEFYAGDPIELRACGGGGTDLRPPFDAVAQDPPDCLIYLTDLYGPIPDSAPEYPVLWACTSPEVAAWGETVRIT